MPAAQPVRAQCGPDNNCDRPSGGDQGSNLSLPDGREQCHDSGPAAACGSPVSILPAMAGRSSTPAGTNACSPVDGKALPSTVATCSGSPAVLAPPAPTPTTDLSGSPAPAPSVPEDSLAATGPTQLTLSATAESVHSGQAATIAATADTSVSGTDLAIEIFDVTTGTLVGACGQGSRCQVSYAALSGVHEFAAFVTAPTTSIPATGASPESNHVRIGWLNTAIAASQTIVGPGTPVTITATSTLDVQPSGRWLEIYDLTAGVRVTYCSRGTECMTTLKMPSAGVHELVAYVTGQPEAVSTPIYVTWLGVSLSATSIGPASGGTVWLKATANADLTSTPWVLGIYDKHGHLVDHACKTGNTCVVSTWLDGSSKPVYTAMIGTLPNTKRGIVDSITHRVGVPSPTPLVAIQAKSTAVEPTHLLWGVDSCKAIVGDPSGDLFWNVVKEMGTPEFWGRYLTDTVCPGIQSGEIALAARYHMGILPIYNDYDCSAVQYYSTGHDYAVAAVAAARRLGIPAGRVIAIDIEPAGAACPGAANVDSGFIEGWYDGISQAGYVPVFYGNGTSGSDFASAWCATVSRLPNIATASDLWTFEPSLLGSFSKVSNPGYAPYDPGCGGNTLAWQYVLSGGAVIDVDQDEAISSLALWYPS